MAPTIGTLLLFSTSPVGSAGNLKTSGVFLTPALLARARENADRFAWAAAIRRAVVDAARPWMKLTDDFAEISLGSGGAVGVAGSRDAVDDVTVGGQSILR